MKNKKAKFDIGHLLLIVVVIVFIGVFGWFSATGKIISSQDSDGDGLSDVKENKTGTDPNNPNTDEDRYFDGEDKDPLNKNSAQINIEVIDKKWKWGSAITNAITLVLKMGSLSSETVIADTEVEILIENKGDDYSKYVNYEIIYEIAGEEVMLLPENIGLINVGEKKTILYQEQILLKDIPNILINSIANWNTEFNIRIENLNYEKF